MIDPTLISKAAIDASGGMFTNVMTTIDAVVTSEAITYHVTLSLHGDGVRHQESMFELDEWPSAIRWAQIAMRALQSPRDQDGNRIPNSGCDNATTLSIINAILALDAANAIQGEVQP